MVLAQRSLMRQNPPGDRPSAVVSFSFDVTNFRYVSRASVSASAGTLIGSPKSEGAPAEGQVDGRLVPGRFQHLAAAGGNRDGHDRPPGEAWRSVDDA